MKKFISIAICPVILFMAFVPTALITAKAESLTAYDLLTMSIADIVNNVYEGDFEVQGGPLGEVPYHLSFKAYLYSDSKLPGIYVITPYNLDQNSMDITQNITSAFAMEVRERVVNESSSPNSIVVKNNGRIDRNLSGNSRYNDFIQYFGEFECRAAGGDGLPYSGENIYLSFEENGVNIGQQGLTQPSELKEKNPKLKYAAVYPGYPESHLIEPPVISDDPEPDPPPSEAPTSSAAPSEAPVSSAAPSEAPVSSASPSEAPASSTASARSHPTSSAAPSQASSSVPSPESSTTTEVESIVPPVEDSEDTRHPLFNSGSRGRGDNFAPNGGGYSGNRSRMTSSGNGDDNNGTGTNAGSSSKNRKKESSKAGTAEIVLIIILSGIVILLIIFIVYMIIKRRNENSQYPPYDLY